jgi:hypothetical protein
MHVKIKQKRTEAERPQGPVATLTKLDLGI